ncbi:MAG: methyltransferase domain-containing protein [Elusimicrobiota bacterium]
MVLGWIVGLMLMVPPVSGYAQGPSSSPEDSPKKENTIYWNNNLELIVKTQEFKRDDIRKVLDILDIRPDMTVLDVGAGSGQAAYQIAERLQDRGEVFATEIDPNLVNYMAGEARRRKLANVHPILVKRDGIDGLYAKHRYDLVLFYNSIVHIRHLVAFLRTMRGFLAKGGRLAVIHERVHCFLNFDRSDFADWEGFLVALEREPIQSPFHRLVWVPARDAVGDGRGGDEMLGRAVLFHLNRLIRDLGLLKYFTNGLQFNDEVSFTPIELDYANWWLHRLHLDGLPNGGREVGSISQAEFEKTMWLNKLLILQRFRSYFQWGGSHPYLSRAPETGWANQVDMIAALIKQANYCLKSERDFPPFRALWIYEPCGG